MASNHMPFREQKPRRSNPNPSKSYRTHKSLLRRDFRCRCGYCNGPDQYFGGRNGAHIDHFAPKSKFPELENEYGNLVYACPTCNHAKADKWYGNRVDTPNNGLKGFVDPCDPALDKHLGRCEEGRIVGLTDLGNFIADTLKLRMVRHQYIWQLSKLETLLEQLHQLRDRHPAHPLIKESILESIANASAKYQQYWRALNAL